MGYTYLISYNGTNIFHVEMMKKQNEYYISSLIIFYVWLNIRYNK